MPTHWGICCLATSLSRSMRWFLGLLPKSTVWRYGSAGCGGPRSLEVHGRPCKWFVSQTIFLHNIGPVCRFSFPWTNPMKWRATICQIDPDWRLWKVYSCTWQCFCRYESKEKSWICQNLHIIWHITNQSSCNTSSAAQGGGGSFKNRKPIGAVGCCEARMAERSHW
jgi:hypothetical protein